MSSSEIILPRVLALDKRPRRDAPVEIEAAERPTPIEYQDYVFDEFDLTEGRPGQSALG